MSLTATGALHGAVADAAAPDPLEPLGRLFRDLRSSSGGLSAREAARRLEVSGPNELARRGGRRWPGELARQFTHPLALLLALAAVLAWLSGSPPLAIAIGAVIVVNAGFAFAQEMQAERAVEALAAFLPERAEVLRDGDRCEIEARLLVPGDVLLIEEGERICADARLISGTVEVDASTLTACQVGTAFAVRTEHASLRSVGVFSNRLLLAGIVAALAFAAALVYLPVMHGIFGTEALSPGQLAIVAPFPFIVWGADEIRRLLVRRYRARHPAHQGSFLHPHH